MRRLVFAAAPLAVVFFTACGDGNDNENLVAESPAADAPATVPANEQPQVPDKPLPTPTPVPSTDPILQVVGPSQNYRPTQADFSALPRASITADGKSYEGVALATLAEQAGAPGAGLVTIQGTRMDNLRLGIIRFPLADIGASTVFVIDESGHLLLASSSVPAEQWLKDVTGISLN